MTSELARSGSLGYLNSVDLNKLAKEEEFDDKRLSIPHSPRQEEERVQEAVTRDTSAICVPEELASTKRV